MNPDQKYKFWLNIMADQEPPLVKAGWYLSLSAEGQIPCLYGPIPEDKIEECQADIISEYGGNVKIAVGFVSDPFGNWGPNK